MTDPTFVTNGPWGTGTGVPHTANGADVVVYDLHLRIDALENPGISGRLITTVTFNTNSITFNYSSGSPTTVPLPIADLEFRGEWHNSTSYLRGHLVRVHGLGIFQALFDHTSDDPPATFDPNLTEGTDPVWVLVIPTDDQNFDIAPFFGGSIKRTAGAVLYRAIMNPCSLPSGNANCFAYLGVAIEDDTAGADDIILSLRKNNAEVGTITFTSGSGDTGGGQEGEIDVPAATDFAAGDQFAILVTQSTNDFGGEDLSITLRFIRTDE